MEVLTPVNNIKNERTHTFDGRVDLFIEEHISVIGNNSILNTVLFNVAMLSLVQLASMSISLFCCILLGCLFLIEEQKNNYRYFLFSLISYVFFSLEFSLISVLATRYYLGTHQIQLNEIVFTQGSFLCYEIFANKSISLWITFKWVLMFVGLLLYKHVVFDNTASLASVIALIKKFKRPTQAATIAATMASFYFIDISAAYKPISIAKFLFFLVIGLISCRILKVLSKSGSVQIPLSSLTSLIITSSIPYPSITAIPLHVKILTFPTIASYSPILKFLLLNTTYMLIQFSYSFKTNSLGLLSDSLHMLLDCISLFLGYMAERSNSNMAKNSSMDNAIGGNSLVVGGFTNGILLLAIAISVFTEGLTRIHTMISNQTLKTHHHRHVRLKNNIELLIVSFMGLVVNLIGIFFFEEHGHSDECSDNAKEKRDSTKNNDNMRGVWLHLLADTMGSVFVVLSTVLHIWFDNLLFDPIFSIGLSFLIFSTAVPLIKNCFTKLMLLNRSEPVKKKGADKSSHSHSHSASHSHSHSHDHSHANSHDHSHSNSCDHENENDPSKHSVDYKEMLGKIEKINGVKGYRQFRFWSSSQSNAHNSHGHSHSHSALSDDDNKQGFIHILIDKKEDFGGRQYLKRKIGDVISDYDIELWFQIEDINEDCWCRR